MHFTPEPDTERFIRNLPKTETHLHLEGALPLELLQKVAPAAYPGPPASWADDYKFESFAQFERELLAMAGHWYTSPARYREAAKHIFEGLVYRQNVHYAEVSFASGMMDAHGMDARAVARAIREAAPRGLQVRVFMGIHHDGYHEGNKSWIDDALTWGELDGLDLHGTESAPLGPWAADLWARARDAGKATKAHAGEFCGPDFVRRMVEELGVRRIEHGVRAVEDPEVVALLASESVTLDVCPISNVKLGVVDDWASHPLKTLMDAGVRCTVSTDDPISFGNTLMDEYAMLAVACEFDHARLAQLARAGFEVAMISEADRTQWLSDFDGIVEEALGRETTLCKV
ncbi:MAG: adenosine deaminase [Rhodothermales bacterium]|jgi:adenosine deaminase